MYSQAHCKRVGSVKYLLIQSTVLVEDLTFSAVSASRPVRSVLRLRSHAAVTPAAPFCPQLRPPSSLLPSSLGPAVEALLCRIPCPSPLVFFLHKHSFVSHNNNKHLHPQCTPSLPPSRRSPWPQLELRLSSSPRARPAAAAAGAARGHRRRHTVQHRLRRPRSPVWATPALTGRRCTTRPSCPPRTPRQRCTRAI